MNWITWCWKLTIALELEILCNGMNIVFFSIFVLGFVDSANRLDWLFNYSRIQTSGSRIGSTFNGQYLGRSPILFVGLLTYSVNIELNWVSWEARQACIPLIMKVIELHRTTPAITRLNGGRKEQRALTDFREFQKGARVSLQTACHWSLPGTLAIIFLDNLRAISLQKVTAFFPTYGAPGFQGNIF